MFYKIFLKPVLFLFPPERAHQLTVGAFRLLLRVPLLNGWARSWYRFDDHRLERRFLGLHFQNPVGLAAGFDKDGKYLDTMAALGFGFIEVGTSTPVGQAGNPQPRLFRLPQDEALINRMGFNNEGAEALAQRLQEKRPPGLIVGGNIGKNKNTPNEQAIDDYRRAFDQLFPFVDYFVVNVSSPNTPDLRALQDREPLTRLLGDLQQLNRAQTAPKPILLKIAPDLNDAQLDDILDIVQETGIAGVIATNTTTSRTNLNTPTTYLETIGAGGLSGKPVKERATEVIRYLYQKSGGQLFIIGVGGIASAEDALEKIEAGASLIQIYTGLIYEGPGLVKRIKRGILERS
ncbi:MAG: quinone-dependent dihydroorotate dehydrogenase [Saprospiraceae bacterium]|nr:quinone-dependent dihydroorotate dehydrogenase [Saprospiraceae bacterium]